MNELELRHKLSAFCIDSQQVEFALLFGSRSRGEATEQSDIDLALRLTVRPSCEERLDLLSRLTGTLQSDALHLILLHGISPLLGYQIARDSRLFYARQPRAFENWRLAALKMYFDARPLFRAEADYVRRFLIQEKEMLDIPLVTRKLRRMAEYLRDLRDYAPIPLAEYEARRKTQYIVERLLQLIIEVATDINNHLIRTSDLPAARDYYESFLLASKGSWITEELATELAPSTGLRNILVHQYEEIDSELVHASIQRTLNLFPEFMSQIQAQLDERATQALPPHTVCSL